MPAGSKPTTVQTHIQHIVNDYITLRPLNLQDFKLSIEYALTATTRHKAHIHHGHF